jgi:hypothetical protein
MGRILHVVILLLILPSMIAGGCTLQPPTVATPEVTPTPAATPQPEAMLTFRVQLGEPLPAGDSLFLAVLDEVTGLALNQTTFVMEAEDALHYIVILPFTLGSVVKYRYIRQGGGMAQEHISDGRPVRYRLFKVDGPALVQDVVSRWTDTTFTGGTGRISGQALDAGDGTPIPNLLIAAGGAQVLTSADGSFLLEGLPAGTHNLVAYSLDGYYRVYQQGASVAAGSATPALLRLSKAPLVKVVFNVSVPPGTINAVPLRLAGSLQQLGNTYADLSGGVSSLPARMPQLAQAGEGHFSITLDLPVGADVRYKYTLGDGLWNAEHTSSGSFRLRQLIVPEGGITLEEKIESWGGGRSAPITFDVSVPANTPKEDFVSIQFNPGFGWTESIPMWSVGDNRWVYVLYSPLDPLGSVRYRYCRNDLCGSADDPRTAGNQAVPRIANTSLLPETMDDQVDSWVWLEVLDGPITLPNIEIISRGAGFITGVEFQPLHHPSWQPRMILAINDLRAMNTGWLFLTPTWTFTRLNPPVLEPVAGSDPLWTDVIDSFQKARSQNLNLAIFPAPRFPTSIEEWWSSASRDFPFWVAWYESYRSFLLHYADLAAQTSAEALVLGGSWLAPALPDGVLADGSPSNPPEDAEDRWRSILVDVRSHYSGRILWALPFPEGVENPPPFLDQVDEVYLLLSAPLGSQATDEEMASEAGSLLDLVQANIYDAFGKTVVLGVAYPSAAGWQDVCPPSQDADCFPVNALARPYPDIQEVDLDLYSQVRAYNAILTAANQRDWVTGFVSRGYYPPAVLHDKSASIHGKPARGVLWYWFPRLTGQVP